MPPAHFWIEAKSMRIMHRESVTSLMSKIVPQQKIFFCTELNLVMIQLIRCANLSGIDVFWTPKGFMVLMYLTFCLWHLARHLIRYLNSWHFYKLEHWCWLHYSISSFTSTPLPLHLLKERKKIKWNYKIGSCTIQIS